MFIYLIGIFFLNGCTSLSESFYRTGIDRRVYENINLKDGVNYREAVILAQRTLLNSKYSNNYFVSNPIVGFDKESNLWGVSFRLKESGYDSCGYTVMIDRDTGKISDGCFSGL
ncbi:hypothetical protein D4Q80_05020 [bacterium]|nr:MAG: hypothetical protein D4Q80_05020 [bacterium]